jgi:hypothetical protein
MCNNTGIQPKQVLPAPVMSAIDNAICTFAVTGKSYCPQVWFKCVTCKLVNNEGCCLVSDRHLSGCAYVEVCRVVRDCVTRDTSLRQAYSRSASFATVAPTGESGVCPTATDTVAGLTAPRSGSLNKGAGTQDSKVAATWGRDWIFLRKNEWHFDYCGFIR